MIQKTILDIGQRRRKVSLRLLQSEKLQ